MPRFSLSIHLFFYLCLTLVNTGIVTSALAAQQSENESSQNFPANISGKAVQVITAAGITYVEVDDGSNKVWAAGVGVAPIKKGDSVSFSTHMPMQNYHSKNLDRDFSLIYFVKQFYNGAEASTSSMQLKQINTRPSIRPEVAKYLGQTREVKTGEYLREATLDGLLGESKKLSDFKGQPLIINVWASWCGPCRAEMDSLQRLANRYNGKEFNIIGISTDDYRDRAIGLIRQTGITFENFIDHKLMLEKMLGANTIPLTLLVDDQGRVLNKVRGAREWDSPQMVDAIGQAFQVTLEP